MASRTQLQTLLETKLGSRHVYFQPPESTKMVYPAIRYSLSSIKTTYASDNTYSQRRAYDLTLIDKNPDSQYVDILSKLPYCRFGRHYVASNLHHFTYTLYF